MRIYEESTTTTNPDGTTTINTTTIDIYGDYEITEPIQTYSVDLDDTTNLTIKHEITLGDLLISTLLVLLIALQTTKWLHAIILERKKRSY